MYTLKLTLEEIRLLDICLHSEDAEKMRQLRFIIASLGRSLAYEEPTEIMISQEELWLMRDLIDPHKQMGKLTGGDLILKLYQLLFGQKFVTLKQTPSPDPRKLPVIIEEHSCQRR